MAKKSYGNSQTNNQIPKPQQNKEQTSMFQKIVKEIPFFAFIVLIIGFVWFVNHSDNGDRQTMTESTMQTDTTKFISSEATETDSTEETVENFVDENDPKQVGISLLVVSSDGVESKHHFSYDKDNDYWINDDNVDDIFTMYGFITDADDDMSNIIYKYDENGVWTCTSSSAVIPETCSIDEFNKEKELAESIRKKYSFDGKSAEEIVALCKSFDSGFCIPNDKEAENDYKLRLQETFGSNDWSLYNNEFCSTIRYQGSNNDNSIQSVVLSWCPPGHFEHHVDESSEYIIDNEDSYELRFNGGIDKDEDGIVSEYEYVDYYSEKEPIEFICYENKDGGYYTYDYKYFKGDFNQYLLRYKNKKLVNINLRIKDYNTAIAVYDSFSNEILTTCDYPTREVKNGDFYVVEQQDSADWRIHADVSSDMPLEYSVNCLENDDSCWQCICLLQMRYEQGEYEIDLIRIID